MKIQIQGEALTVVKHQTTNKLFYLTTIPGLESVTHLELCEKWGRAADFFDLPAFPKAEFHRGGLEFEAPLSFGLVLPKLVRSCTKLLVREAEFSARNQREFKQGIQTVAWQHYLSKEVGFKIQFTSKSSKLSMKRQVVELISHQLKPQKIKPKEGGVIIHVRLFRDQCNISFDCSGGEAFKRKDGSVGSIASLRETTASGLLRVLIQGLCGPYDLIDPMCGSGTFLKEASQISQTIGRDFAYQKFSFFKDNKPKCQQVLELFKDPIGPDVPNRLFGFDLSDRALSVAKTNLKEFPDLVLKKENILNIETSYKKNGNKTVVVVNPPWGKRLSVPQGDLLKAIHQKFDPWRIGFLMPSHWKLSDIPMEKVRDLAILNSGVENRFLVFQKNK